MNFSPGSYLLMVIWFPVHFLYDLDDLDSVKVTEHAKYLGQSLFSSKVIPKTHMHTHWTDCSTWTTERLSPAINRH